MGAHYDCALPGTRKDRRLDLLACLYWAADGVTAGCSKTSLSTSADPTTAQPQQFQQIRSRISIIAVQWRTEATLACAQSTSRPSAGVHRHMGKKDCFPKQHQPTDVYKGDDVFSVRSEFLATDTEVSGSIPGATRFSE